MITRDPVADRIGSVVVAALSRTRRGLVSELALTTADGVPTDSVVNFDNIHTVPRDRFRRRVTTLPPARLAEACRVLQAQRDADSTVTGSMFRIARNRDGETTLSDDVAPKMVAEMLAGAQVRDPYVPSSCARSATSHRSLASRFLGAATVYADEEAVDVERASRAARQTNVWRMTLEA